MKLLRKQIAAKRHEAGGKTNGKEARYLYRHRRLLVYLHQLISCLLYFFQEIVEKIKRLLIITGKDMQRLWR
jgi:hypothetical protein